MAPNLAAGPDGSVFMTWIAPAGPIGHSLFFAIYAKGAWSEPRIIASGGDWFVNFADVPSMAVMADGTLAAHWLANHLPGTEGAHVQVAFSRDRGVTWSSPVVPHRDRSRYQHGFVSLVPLPAGGLHAIWLDGRNTKGEGHGDMALMQTTIGVDGTIGSEVQVDERACDCCPTSAAVTADGVIAVYRDRSEQEIRDIAVVRFTGGRWSQPEPILEDGWEIHACPVNGPAVSSSGTHAVVAWFTAASNQPRVYAALSADAGRTFGRPIRINQGAPVGRVDAMSLADGGALVSWMERTDQRQELRVRRISPEGVLQVPVVVPDASVAPGVAPRMKGSADHAVIAWTDTSTPRRVRAALVRFDRGSITPQR
jgi:hypothetical protein